MYYVAKKRGADQLTYAVDFAYYYAKSMFSHDAALLSEPSRHHSGGVKNITRTCPCDMQHFLKAVKMIILEKNDSFFLIFAQNIDCGYTLEMPQ